jgi:nitric oxide reductase large subunit
MKKERTLAIIGIALLFIGLCFATSTYYPGYDPDPAKVIAPTSLPFGAEPYPEAIQNQIWVQCLSVMCILSIYQLFFCCVTLSNGRKSGKKIPVVLSIIGICLVVLSVSVFFGSGIDGWGILFMSLYTPYTLAFSIIMLVRSFKKPEIEA